MEPHQLPWSPLDPAALPDLLAGVGAPWWLAGGWAIDAFVGRVTRVHEDIDVLVLRRDQAAFRSALTSWDVHAADPPGALRPWPVGETLPVGVHDVWCRPTLSSPWALQLMIDDTDGEDWVYRRDARLRRPVSSLAGLGPRAAGARAGGPAPAEEQGTAPEGRGRPRRRRTPAVPRGQVVAARRPRPRLTRSRLGPIPVSAGHDRYGSR